MGNHTWGRRELVPYLERSREVLRPANLPQQQPGRGWCVFETPFCDVAVIDLIGRCGMDYTPQPRPGCCCGRFAGRSTSRDRSR